MSSLTVKINDTKYSDMYCNMSLPYEQSNLMAVVSVDGSDTLNQFSVTCDCDWITLNRTRNNISIIVKSNVRVNERVGTLMFKHNLDENVYVMILVTQGCAEYSISASCEGSNRIMFNTLLDRYTVIDGVKQLINKETVQVTVNAVNGFRDFGVRPVIEFVRNAGEGSDTEKGENWPESVDDIIGDNYHITNYDGGLKIHKVSQDTLEITNYGKISLYDKVFYVVKLYHVNNPNEMSELYVGYIDSNENNGNGMEFDDGE